MNRDGSFNVVRGGLAWNDFLHPYHRLLTVSWGWFFALVMGAYLFTNVIFAIAYLLCGKGALAGGEAAAFGGRFWNAFFFSVQTLATIGYGKMTPEGLAANLLVAFEALFGLMGFAFITGLLFARFSRPSARVVFSDVAVVAPYREITGLMFRLANGRTTELTDVRASVTLTRFETVDGRRIRRFYALNLERSQVAYFTVQWIVVHPIDRDSPLYGMTEAEFHDSEPELLVAITGIDETFSQAVFTRSSYVSGEIVWGAKFRDIYENRDGVAVFLDVRRLGEIDPA